MSFASLQHRQYEFPTAAVTDKYMLGSCNKQKPASSQSLRLRGCPQLSLERIKATQATLSKEVLGEGLLDFSSF